jgi:hypothetical protein
MPNRAMLSDRLDKCNSEVLRTALLQTAVRFAGASTAVRSTHSFVSV